MTSVADVVSLGKQQVVMRARDVTRSLEPSFFVPGVLKSFKDNRVLAEVREGTRLWCLAVWSVHPVLCRTLAPRLVLVDIAWWLCLAGA